MKRTILALLPTGMVGAARPCGMGHGDAVWQYGMQCRHQSALRTRPNFTTTPSRRPRSTAS